MKEQKCLQAEKHLWMALNLLIAALISIKMKTNKNIMAISLRGLNQITHWETITGMAQEWSR